MGSYLGVRITPGQRRHLLSHCDVSTLQSIRLNQSTSLTRGDIVPQIPTNGVTLLR